MNLKKVVVLVSVCISIPLLAHAKDHDDNAGKHMVLNLTGSGDMYESKVPDIDGDGVDDNAMCFDVHVVDARNNQVIGRGTDCLSKVTPTGTGVALVGTTYFHLPAGTLITRGKTSVQPVLQPTITPRGLTVTHITGAASDQNSVIGGTGRFANASGKVRLSGMVSMANFSGNAGDPIVFDCLFVVDLD